MKMYDNYSPLDLIRHPFSNPIFYHEVKRLRWIFAFGDLRHRDWVLVWKVFMVEFGIVIVLGICGASSQLTTPFYFSVYDLAASIFAFIAPLAGSIIVDLYTVSATVTFWHAHAQADQLDMLRLTLPTDAEMLTTLRAAAELMVWRGQRWEMALRSFVAFCGIALGVLATVVLTFALITSKSSDPSRFAGLLAILYVVWAFRMLRLYLREPLWRMRTLVAMSIAVAEHTAETNMAILIGSAVAMCLKIVQIAVVIGLLLVTLREPQQALGPLSPAVLSIMWIVASGVFTTVLVRMGYARLHSLVTWYTLQHFLGATGDWRIGVRHYTGKRRRDAVTTGAEEV